MARQGTALVLSVVVMLAAFVGFGGAKVRGKIQRGPPVVHHRRFGRQRLCPERGADHPCQHGSNIITTGANTLGADSAEVQAAQAALDDFSACLEAVQNGSKKQDLTSLPYYQGSTMHALYQANEALGAAIDQLYAKLQERAETP